MNTNWTQVTLTEQSPTSDGIDFVMTPQVRDAAQLVKLDIIAQTRRKELFSFTPGLDVREIDPSDATDKERAAFGMGGL